MNQKWRARLIAFIFTTALGILTALVLATWATAAPSFTQPMMVLGHQNAPLCSAWAATRTYSDGWAYGITALHCQSGKEPLLRLNKLGIPVNHRPITWVAKYNDILIFRYRGPERQVYFKIGTELPPYYAKIAAVGYHVVDIKGVQSLQAFRLPGIYIGDYFPDGTQMYLSVWMPVQGGNSGGPVGFKDAVFGVIGMKFPSGVMGVADVRKAPAIIEAERQCRLNKGGWDIERSTCYGN